MAKKKMKHKKVSKRTLWIAIAAVSILLVALILTAVLLSRKDDTPRDDQSVSSTQATTLAAPSTPSQPDDDTASQPSEDTQTPEELQPTDDPETPDANIPEEYLLELDEDVYLIQMANYSGRFVEDGSDASLENYCAVVVENRSNKTIQLLQFTIPGVETVYSFRLTTLPPGERAIVQELERTTLANDEVIGSANVEACVYFSEEPSLHEDVFTISGSESGIELKNCTDREITGPIYVYYKTRTADGYVGGITYRVTIPTLKADETYKAAVNHFWPGSSQVMFIEYAQ